MGKTKLKSKTVESILDIVPIINYLEENLNGEIITVNLRISPRRLGYCSRKRTANRKMKIKKHSDIDILRKFILNNWTNALILVSIE